MTTNINLSHGETPSDALKSFQRHCQDLSDEISKVIVGHKKLLEHTIITLLAGGNILIEGAPGLGKTMFVRTLAQTLGLQFSRIQFTPDLMPMDIIGATTLQDDDHGNKIFRFEKGPVFTNILLADEINRGTPKTQSAMLEAMQEQTVTVGNQSHQLGEPFFVIATQNPLEMEGTYPLPEAQLDRFMFMLKVDHPSLDELHEIIDRTTHNPPAVITTILDRDRVLLMKHLARQAPVVRHVQDYALRILLATHPEHPSAPPLSRKYIRYGASPRGAQSILSAARVRALYHGRFNVSLDDVEVCALPALRHRIIPTFEAQAERIQGDDIIQSIIDIIPRTA